MKLFLGCGPFPIHKQHLEIVDDSWIFIDKYVKNPKIVNMDIKSLEYPDSSAERIYCSHTLEHIGLKEIIPTLKEWYRVLKPGGDVIINVPDIEWAAVEMLRMSSENWLQDTQVEVKKSRVFDTQEKVMEVIFGNQDHEGEFHKSGYTYESLKKYLWDTGYKKITVKRIFEAHEMGCLVARGFK